AVPVLLDHVISPVDTVTVLLPVPVLVTVSVLDEFEVKLAVTYIFLDITTVHVGADPKQSPFQPVKIVPPDAVAVRITFVPSVYVSVPVVEPDHVRKPVETVTLPLPFLVTVSILPEVDVNLAVTLISLYIVIVHVGADPKQSPPQPIKTAP
ncbi:hypothetical protein MBAV_005780, partial [Candidatus Magnetobacterium bavaricum]